MKISLLLFLLLNSLFAHKLNIFLIQENEDVIISSYFASGSYCKNCKVEIYNLKDELIEKAKTNKKGEYLIKKPKESLRIKVEAIGGHAAFASFEVSTNANINKKVKTKHEEIKIKSFKDSLIQSFIAILLIMGIFLLLKKNKKIIK